MKDVIVTEVEAQLVAHVELEPAVRLVAWLHRQRNYLLATLRRVHHL